MAEEEEISKAEAMVEETQDVEEEEEAAGTTRAPNPNIPTGREWDKFCPEGSSLYLLCVWRRRSYLYTMCTAGQDTKEGMVCPPSCEPLPGRKHWSRWYLWWTPWTRRTTHADFISTQEWDTNNNMWQVRSARPKPKRGIMSLQVGVRKAYIPKIHCKRQQCINKASEWGADL